MMENEKSRAGARRSWRRLAGVGAMIAGTLFLTGAAVVSWQLFNAEPLYRYDVQSIMQDQNPDQDDPGATSQLRHGAVVDVRGGVHLADFEIADSDNGPVLMSWQPRVDAPFLNLLPPYSEVVDLAEVIQRHVEQGTQVLAWWDSSRQLQHLAGVDVVFGQHLGQPLFVPSAWRPWEADVLHIEQAFWGAQADRGQQERFQLFTDALLMSEKDGMEQLRRLGNGSKTVLVLHARDAILLGQIAPSRLGVAFREFTDTGDVHGSVTGVHGWLTQHDYPAYTITRTGASPLRAIALTDDSSGMTLIARLLPFIGNAQHDVEGARLVYKTGGFIVYEIMADTAVSALAEQGK